MGTLTAYLPLLQAEANDSGSNPLLEASPGLMIWTLVMFLITLWIMKKWVFGPVSQMVQKRLCAARRLQGAPRRGPPRGRRHP